MLTMYLQTVLLYSSADTSQPDLRQFCTGVWSTHYILELCFRCSQNSLRRVRLIASFSMLMSTEMIKLRGAEVLLLIWQSKATQPKSFVKSALVWNGYGIHFFQVDIISNKSDKKHKGSSMIDVICLPDIYFWHI